MIRVAHPDVLPAPAPILNALYVLCIEQSLKHPGSLRSMQLLYHHRTQSEDAQGIHISEMIKAFRDLGHDVEMVALVEANGERERKVRGNQWKWFIDWMPRWFYELMSLLYNLYGYYRLRQMIKLKRPALLYERYSLNTFCGLWASRRWGIPLVLEVNAPLYHEESKFGKLTFQRLALFSERWICSHSTWTFVVSHVMKDILVQEGVPPEKMVVVPNGIDPQQFHPGISGDAIRKRYQLEDKLVIGFVGWFRPWHGLELLLEIVHEMRLADHGVCLLLVGDGPACPALHHYVTSHSLESTVIFTGAVKQQEVAAHIAAMDIAVQPSAPEYACPMKIFEYMGLGKCIVAPDQPNIREILDDGESCLLFQVGDKASLGAVLWKLLHDPEQRAALGRKAYHSIFERGFLWQANAKKTLALVLGK